MINFIVDNKKTLSADVVIVSGDISHDGEMLSYEHFFKGMVMLGLPFYFFPGNHDNKLNLRDVSLKYGHDSDVKFMDNNYWKVLSIDTVVDNEDYGYVAEDALRAFEYEVNSNSRKNVALFLHHHLIPVGTPIVDECMLMNASDVLFLCSKTNVKFIGSGHAHTLFQRKIGDILVSVSPAICSQWKNGTKDINSIDNSGFSIVCLSDQVHVETWFI